jgi:hypothetical protein
MYLVSIKIIEKKKPLELIPKGEGEAHTIKTGNGCNQ